MGWYRFSRASSGDMNGMYKIKMLKSSQLDSRVCGSFHLVFDLSCTDMCIILVSTGHKLLWDDTIC